MTSGAQERRLTTCTRRLPARVGRTVQRSWVATAGGQRQTLRANEAHAARPAACEEGLRTGSTASMKGQDGATSGKEVGRHRRRKCARRGRRGMAPRREAAGWLDWPGQAGGRAASQRVRQRESEANSAQRRLAGHGRHRAPRRGLGISSALARRANGTPPPQGQSREGTAVGSRRVVSIGRGRAEGGRK